MDVRRPAVDLPHAQGERVRADDTAGSLLERLAQGGAGLLVATLDGIADGSIEAREQPADGVSLAPKITVEDAHVDWTEPAVAVDRRIRACTRAAKRRPM